MAENTTSTSEKRSTLHPYLCAHDAAGAIDFYRTVFGATETMRLTDPSGKIGHAELMIGNATIMLADEHPEFGVFSPRTLGGSPVAIHLEIPDVDAVAEAAVAAGATIVTPVTDQFYGDRSGTIKDPFGHVWMISTHKEDMSAEEMQRRYDEIAKE